MQQTMGSTTDRNRKERAFLVSVMLKEGNRSNDRQSLEELAQLAETADIEVVDTFVQQRDRIDPKRVIGKGKVEEIRMRMDEVEVDTVIFDQELSGMQVRNLEQMLDVKIIDRTQLILDIFASRAKTSEGKLQVELAQLNYLLPRLAGHYRNLSRLGGGIGTRGPGETKLEMDRRHIHRRIRELERRLQAVERHRHLQRESRSRSGYVRIGLVGYTNAGKSTLLHRLTGSDTVVEDKLFATLDPMTRKAELPDGTQVLVSDTVGFIRHLPHDLVSAFKSTLEETLYADLLLIVVDGSNPDWFGQLKVVHQVLDELGASAHEQLTVFNKVDKCTPTEQGLLTTDGAYIRISAYNDQDIERLKRMIRDRLPGEIVTFELPASDGKRQALVHQCGDVLETNSVEERLVMRVKLDANEYRRHRAELEPYVIGSPLEDGQDSNQY